jgi:hypothetical protein
MNISEVLKELNKLGFTTIGTRSIDGIKMLKMKNSSGVIIFI